MYLKNDSSFQCGLRTKKEVLTINPGDIVSVLEKDIININSFLIETTEEEYFNFVRQNNKQDKEPTEEKPVVKENKENKKDKKEKEVKEVKEVVVPTKEVKPQTEEPIKDKEKEVTTPANTELEELEAKLVELKEKWQNTSRASKKATIQKEIKAVQEQIAKLK